MRMTFNEYMADAIRDDLRELFNQYRNECRGSEEEIGWVSHIEELDTMSLDDLIKANLLFVHADELHEFMSKKMKVYLRIAERECE